jgi:hypothetical protein
MSIYSYQKVLDFIQEHQVDCYLNKWGWWFKKYQPDLYEQILSQTDHLSPKSFTDRLYCYANGITQRPKCKMCDNDVTYHIGKKAHHDYCSNRCSMKDMISLIGVENSSQLPSVNAKKKQTYRARYGVDHYNQTTASKKNNANKARKRWEKFWEGVPHESKYQYTERVGYLTDRNYRRYKDILDPQGLRSHQWHLDHVFSKSDGFRYNVDPVVVAHPANLRIISASANSSKNFRSEISLQVLLERIEEWNKIHSSNDANC